MTKKINITNLKEIKGIKLICGKCGSYVMAPINADIIPPNECVMCKQKFEGSYISETLKSIDSLVKYCSKSGFESVVETEEE